MKRDILDPKKKCPGASLIIAVYNMPDFLEKIFLSLANQTVKDFEIIVSEDGSNREIKKVVNGCLNAFSYPVKHAWHEDKGFRKTVIANKAVLLSDSDYLIFIDGDCVLHSRFIESHLKRRHKDHVLAGRRVKLNREITGRITNKDIIQKRIENPDFWKNHCKKSTVKYGRYNTIQYHIRNIIPKRFEFIGCNFSLHKSDFINVNGYDERIITRGLEDNNLCSRLIKDGKKIRYLCREAIQYHFSHTFKNVIYSRETVKKFTSYEPWTPYGIRKN
ncbi:MAG: glycosyltransferase [Chitinispirillia bacterium]|jgi:cellulose synthase/poly-beta-1,6-N-acetylglucosamine synthase-like glycosyltransferase